MATYDDPASELPRLRVSFGFQDDTPYLENDDDVAEFFDVKFCPYQPLDCDPIFAAVSKKHVVLCRISHTSGEANPCEIIGIIRDDDAEASACCCTWTKDPVSGRPLICIGGVDAKVKIYDVLEGKLFRCFSGHGSDVNDLATNPVNPSIIASASDDTSVRIWSIDPKHQERPCLCILAGEGHSSTLLSVAFHDSGRFILSGGHDQIVNLWTLPDLPTEPISVPLRVHYPHFSTSAVHSGIVDCVAFYGDLILSRACHDNVIALWRIEGFSSDGPPPSETIAPTPQTVIPNSQQNTQGGVSTKHDTARLTRSAFVPTISPQCPAQYTRILNFQTPNCGVQFFMRFKLHFVPDQHPVLAFCNAGGNIFFWDLKRLSIYSEFIQQLRKHDMRKPFPPGHHGSDRCSTAKGKPLGNLGSLQTGEEVKRRDEPKEFSAETLQSWADKYSLDNPHKALHPHKIEPSTANFVGRQAAWSPGGEWCVVVGSDNQAMVFQRWAKKIPPKAPKPVHATSFV
ncbi:WD40-repeat-containing domain protein [Mariannaea sp. PMI_226]|nr:WD40-repeat-containing domain protein [Mariannaea sp. PMI_226]